MRFYLDENLSDEIAAIARALGLDVVSSHELRHDELADEDQLSLAARDGRCLVTVDRDFIRLTSNFFAQQRPHAGVLIVPSTWRTADFARIARALARFSEAHAGATMAYLWTYLSD